MGRKATSDEESLQEKVRGTPNELVELVKALTTLQCNQACMANRATAAFVFSIIGAAYQLTSLYVAVLVDRSTNPFYYTVSFDSLFLTSLVVVWSASHILEDWKGQITWPSIILAVGIANMSTVIIAYYVQNLPTQPFPTTPSPAGATLALLAGPLLNIVGGILGFSAVRQYSREHGHAVLGHA